MTVWADEVTADNPGGPPAEDDADALEAAELLSGDPEEVRTTQLAADSG